MVQGAFDHSLRHGGAVLGKDVLFQTAAVHTDADGYIFGVAGIRHRLDAVVGPDVAGVDADLVGTGIQRCQRGAVIKVDIGHDGDIHGLFNGGHHGGILRRGHGHAHDLAARLGDALCLCHVAGNILDRHVEHRLHGNGMVAANGNVADFHFPFQLTVHGLRLLKKCVSRPASSQTASAP